MWIAVISQKTKWIPFCIPSKTRLQKLLDPKILKPSPLRSVHAIGGERLARRGSSVVPEWNQNTGPLTSGQGASNHSSTGTKAQVLQTSKQEGSYPALPTAKSPPGTNNEEVNSDRLPGQLPVAAIWKTRTTASRHILASLLFSSQVMVHY